MRNETATESALEAKTSLRDVPTIIAISVLAFAITNVIHEGAGHGGACLLSGGQARVLSTVHFECSIDSRFIAAGGTLANLVVGFVSWLVFRASRSASGSVRFFWWLLMTVNLMTAAGYWFFSGAANIGDWVDVVHGLHPGWAWRVFLALFGIATYSLVVWFALHELRPMLSSADLRRGGAKDLTIIPYLAGGVLCTVAGLFNPVGMVLVAISAAASSFGGTSGLAWMTQYNRTRPGDETATGISLPRSPGWISAAVMAGALFIGFLAKGVRF